MVRFNPARCLVLLVIGIAISALPFHYLANYWANHHAFPSIKSSSGKIDPLWPEYGSGPQWDGNIEYTGFIDKWPEKPLFPRHLRIAFLPEPDDHHNACYTWDVVLPNDNFWKVYRPMPKTVRICLRKTLSGPEYLLSEEMMIFTNDEKKELILWCGPKIRQSPTYTPRYSVPHW